MRVNVKDADDLMGLAKRVEVNSRSRLLDYCGLIGVLDDIDRQLGEILKSKDQHGVQFDVCIHERPDNVSSEKLLATRLIVEKGHNSWYALDIYRGSWTRRRIKPVNLARYTDAIARYTTGEYKWNDG